MALPAPSGKVKLTYEQFLEQLDEDTLAEWVDGEVVYLSPAGLEHQQVGFWLARYLAAFLDANPIGTLVPPPFQMRLLRSERGRGPDLLFVSKENLHRLHDTYLEGGADLVVEITPPESLLRDRGEKYAEYELEGVREYWIINPDERRVDFFVLGADGRYERRREDAEGVYHSEVLKGFKLPVRWLWERPSLREVLNQLEQA